MLTMHFCFKQNSFHSWGSSCCVVICTLAMMDHLLQTGLGFFFSWYINSHRYFKDMPWSTRESAGRQLCNLSDNIWYILSYGRTLFSGGLRSFHDKAVSMSTSYVTWEQSVDTRSSWSLGEIWHFNFVPYQPLTAPLAHRWSHCVWRATWVHINVV